MLLLDDLQWKLFNSGVWLASLSKRHMSAVVEATCPALVLLVRLISVPHVLPEREHVCMLLVGYTFPTKNQEPQLLSEQKVSLDPVYREQSYNFYKY